MSATGELRVHSPGDLDGPERVFPWSLDVASAAVDRARAAQPAWEALGQAQRLDFLRKLRERFVAHKDDFALLLGIEVGKPLWEGAQEAQLLVGKIDATLAHGLQLVAPHRLGDGAAGEWRARAHGVLAVLGPFNFPVHLPNGHIVPALALGNTVVFKPSELTPACGALYAQCVAEAGFPAGVCQVVQGERTLGAYLSGEAAVDGVLFTGSVSVGNAIARANADKPGKILALELGGKNAAIVFADTDLDRAAYQIAFGGYVTAGQRCSSTSRCLVDRSVLDALQAKLAALARGLTVGPFEAPGTFMGPLITAEARERFLAQLRGAGPNAEPIVAPRETSLPGKRGHFVRPSLHRVEAWRPAEPYQAQELFGPDIALHGFDSEDEAVALANGTRFGLCAAVYSADRARFERLSGSLRAGVINWNSPTVGASGKLPFGGVGDSGNHRPAGIFSALYCSWPVALSYGATGPSPDAPTPGL